MSIGVILNTYKRDRLFPEQLAAIRGQSVSVDKLIVWRNADNIPDEEFKGVDYVKASRNMGVWPRLSLARDLQTDLICIIDDDTIPGRRFLELCLELYSKEPCLLCVNGFIFSKNEDFTEKNFHNRKQVGWVKPENKLIQVDWCGHLWFFDQEVMRKSFQIPRVSTDTSGEDAHLSFSAQQVGQKCYVTPYGPDKEFWGSLKGPQGNDKHATHRILNQKQKMIQALNFYRKMGWEFINK